MMKSVFALLALFATASAFAPAAFAVTKSTSLNMVDPSALDIPSIMSTTQAVATDGTNEWFGVDDLRLLGVLFIGHWFILTLWLQQYNNKNYDEEEDFFGEIDYSQAKR